MKTTIDPKEAFPIRLKLVREKRKLSQAELARRSGVTQGHISEYEAGISLPGLDKAVLLANTLRKSLDYLAGRKNV